MNEPREGSIFEFKRTTSRGRDTYGYAICTLYVDGVKATCCNGGGYDMRGTCLGEWITEAFQDKLRKLPANSGSGDKLKGFYGLSHFDQSSKKWVHTWNKNVKKSSCNGACGFSTMECILTACGYCLQYIGLRSCKNNSVYQLKKVAAKRRKEVMARYT